LLWSAFGDLTNYINALYFLEYNPGFKDVIGNDRLNLEDAVAMSDELLNHPTALDEAALYFNNLEISSPALFKMIADRANEISAMPIPILNANSKLWYRCAHCGRLRNRKDRARDCPNSDLGIKPYKCGGECGNTSWFVQKPLPCRPL
jgi:hypothetical protein